MRGTLELVSTVFLYLIHRCSTLCGSSTHVCICTRNQNETLTAPTPPQDMPICQNSASAVFCDCSSPRQFWMRIDRWCVIFTHSEWLAHQHRDTLASIVGHPTLLSYLAIADGESLGRVKFEMTEVHILTSALMKWDSHRTFHLHLFSGCYNRVARRPRRTMID